MRTQELSFPIAHPGSVRVPVAGSGGCRSVFNDGLTRWLETFADRVSDGTYVVSPLQPNDPDTTGLCLFPQKPVALLPISGGLGADSSGGGAVTVAVTRGVEVTASVIYMEMAEQWTYSIGLRVLVAGEPGYVPAAERGFETCQLSHRHWVIADSEGRVDHVRGAGVVGIFPLLREGGFREDNQVPGPGASPGLPRLASGTWRPGRFAYQSCSGRSAPGGSFGGELTLVPGSITESTGPPFDVVVGRFSLALPEYMF